MGWTVTDLISKVKLWAAVPDGQPAFSDAEILGLMTNELFSNITPLIISFQEEYFITTKDYTIATGTNEYAIPSKAAGNILRDIKIKDGDTYTDIPKISITALSKHTFGFYVIGNNIYLISPSNYNGKTLRMYYYYRPNQLAKTTDTTTPSKDITVISGTTLTLSTMPTVWVSDTTKLDIVKGTPPFTIFEHEVTGTISGTDITFSSVPSGLEVGDYVCTSGYSPVANIPLECQYLLCQATVLKILESLIDSKGMALAIEKYKKMELNVQKLLTPRITGKLKKLVQYDSFLNRDYWYTE
jgi:hypothetical protein